MDGNKLISRLHYLTQDGAQDADHTRLAEIACEAGVKWLQLRMKGANENELLKTANAVKKITDKYNCTLIINDHVSIAQFVNADGVHLGKNDMPVKEAREILGTNKIIGGTANTPEDIFKLVEEGVDYIGLGPYRFTSTKKNLSPVLGIEGISKLVKIQHTIPIIIIGGIQLNDVDILLKTGAWGIAVASAINLAKNKTFVLKQFIELTDKAGIGIQQAALTAIS